MPGHNIGPLPRASSPSSTAGDMAALPSVRERLRAASNRRAARSAALAGAIVAALATALAVGSVILTGVDERWNSSMTLAAIGATFLLLGLGGGPLLRGLAVARLRWSHPDALVFLTLRELTRAPHLQTYQHRKDNTANLPDNWTVSMVDSRGLSAWSGGLRPKELVLIGWSEVGDITAASFTSLAGRGRIGASIDIRPVPVPLLIRLGSSSLGVEGAFDEEGVHAIVDGMNVIRNRRP